MLFLQSGARSPGELTEACLVRWCSHNVRANNTVRSRITVATSFLRWCEESGIPAPRPTILRHLRRQFPATYGKVQHTHPGRWLTRTQAFDQFIRACQDSTILGLRDETVIRLGLAGMRNSEIGTLTVAALRLDDSPPSVAWIGKGRKPRRLIPGARLVIALRKYMTLYADAVGPVDPDAPLICPRVNGTRIVPRLNWGTPLRVPDRSIHQIVTTRAAQAGLGHVTPHDLRRSTAGILHREKSTDGGHRFDLLDIQQVLGHADPATTMRHYLEPIDNDTLENASTFLD